MRSADPTASQLDVQIVEADDSGRVVLSMVVTAANTNSLGVCHGGVLFTLADIVMNYVSNGDGDRAFAQHASVDFIAPVEVGSTLRAAGVQVSRRGRNGICDVSIWSDHELVATFRGRTVAVGGSITA